jgi:hypothetical protein
MSFFPGRDGRPGHQDSPLYPSYPFQQATDRLELELELELVHRSPFTVRRSPFAVHRSPFTVRRSPFAVHRAPSSSVVNPLRRSDLGHDPPRRRARTRLWDSKRGRLSGL